MISVYRVIGFSAYLVSYTINAEVSLFHFSPFLGKTYTPTQLRYPNGELKSIIEADDTLTFSFSNDSADFEGFTGCNYFSGGINTFTSDKYEASKSIAGGESIITEKACSMAINEQESAYRRAVLDEPRLYESDDENLVLYEVKVDSNGNEVKGDT